MRESKLAARILGNMTLKARLTWVFTTLMLLCILFSAVVIYTQHRLTVQTIDSAVSEYGDLDKAVRLREVLENIRQLAGNREVSAERIARFESVLKDLRATHKEPMAAEMLQEIHERFSRLNDTLASPMNLRNGSDLLRVRFEDVSAAVEGFIDYKQDHLYRMAHMVRQDQKSLIRTGLIFLAIFILLLLACAMAVISVVVEPLSGLARFLDDLNFSENLPAQIPRFESKVPEVSRVAQSFEQLLYRLRGYQALNVRRLIGEKRRADIIAASIADGIFLLRGEELLYVNPVGERILGLPAGIAWKGLRLNQLPPQLQSAPEPGERRKRTGLDAVRIAIASTIPVDIAVDSADRKQYFLLQSYPISDAVIEQVEHSFNGPVEQLLDRWQANTLVLAQDVTLVKESQEAKSHFIGTLSHEVKTPVTSLTMATRLLRKAIDQIPNPNHRALIQTCAEDVDRLRGLIEDLLSVSRFDTLTQRLEIQNVDLAKMLKQSVQYFQTQAFEKGVEMITSIRVPGGRMLIPMDATKVSWALSNLLTNALRHTPRGGKVEATLDAMEEVVEIRIRDHGPGIDRNRQERIFDKFNPFYDLRIARTGSIGMGLAIAREIVVAHGGRIWVSSEPGHGAEFCFTLPLKRGSTPVMLTGNTDSSTASSSSSSSSENSKGDHSGASARR